MAAKVAALCPPLRGGRSHHSDPWREGHRAGQEAGAGHSGAGQQRGDRPQLAHWPRPVPRRTVASTPDVRRVEPHGCQLVEGFVPIRSVAIPLSTRPFTARKVHENPIQNGGCNEGNGSALEHVSYLYK